MSPRESPPSDVVTSNPPLDATGSQRALAQTAVSPMRVVRSGLFGSFPGLPSVHVYLTSTVFCVSWWLILFLHVLLGSFAFSITALHVYLQKPQVAMAISSIQVPRQTIRITARSFFLVGFAHFVAIVRMVYRSIEAKRLTLHSLASTKSFVQAKPAPHTMAQYALFGIDVVTTAWSKVFSGTGFFGLSGPYFEILFTVREAVEIVMQTYQAYYLSWSVPRAWINHLAVASIVLNCVASPIVHWRYKKSHAKRRLVSLIHDAMLDFCCSVVIPLSIVLPYAAVFNPTTSEFPFELVMDDVWYVNAISEGRQVLVTSFLDYISTLLPQLGLLSCLSTIKNVLRRRSHKPQPVANVEAFTSSPPPATKPTSSKRSLLRSAHLFGAKPFPSTTIERIHVAQRLRHATRSPEYIKSWRQFLLHLVFLLWGVVVLGLHIDAQIKSSQNVTGCQLHVNAWASTGYPCSVLVLNCHQVDINGSTQEIAEIMNSLERSSLQVLVISHCPGLEIPPVLTEFARLGGMELFNCSLVAWPMEASLRESTQPRFGYLFVVLTNWTTFPQGLLHRELPTQLTHLIVANTSLTELPEDIGHAWGTQDWITISIEQAPQLNFIPQSFCQLRVVSLRLSSTQISSFPLDCFALMGLQDLGLSGNPVTQLPEDVGSHPMSLSAEHTLITELPAWFGDWLQPEQRTASLFGSPVCNSTQLHNGTQHWDSLCVTDLHTDRGIYPWEFMLPRRPYDVAA